MSVGSPTAGTWSSSQWRPDNEFETDRLPEDENRLVLKRFTIDLGLTRFREHLTVCV